MSDKVQKYNIPVLKKNQPDENYKFRMAPEPSGTYPFHLNLQDVQPTGNLEKKMVFHMLGDTGSIHHADFLREVAAEMVRQFENSESDEDKPGFLYHLGDIVYNHGEATQYARQFFEPFENYPSSIFAIAGNHDSDVNPDSSEPYDSLSAFKAVFCDTEPRTVPFSGNSRRKSMIQPNVFWTLETPLATIIGPHSNVPKYGIITAEQRNWLVEELKAARQELPRKALIICLHHAPYSADINHGSSLPMIEMLEGVFEETGIRPDIVFSGHVHNYQRFIKKYADGKEIPFVVAGAGGYDGLHEIVHINDENFYTENPLLKDVTLECFCDNQHGFLKISIEKKDNRLTLTGSYYAISHHIDVGNEEERISSLWDRFEIEIN
ncbi:metallophosphoesterase [Dyadobacter flavalbus]|uniref:Metallophosphoesterase n=1 Tax=Dyadobacter flavalbus TaxID=2579942 RepID=A0A5M8QQC1_9BACT|nr:metallophosphoesterase [Dyadobacter flavalbus]KAA6438289.1 metallophosphoesterase [Dyadobacter flavalbus]